MLFKILFFILFVHLKMVAQFSHYYIYIKHIQKADSFYLLNNYTNAVKYYRLAFIVSKNRGYKEHREKYIKSYYYSNQVDSAVTQFYNMIKHNEIDSWDGITTDTCFNKLLQKVNENIIKKLIAHNFHIHHDSITIKLNEMVRKDQYFLNLQERVLKKELSSDSIQNYTESMCKIQIENLRISHNKILKKIFRKIKYPGFNKVGKVGSQNYWILLQHQDNDVEFQYQNLLYLKKLLEKQLADPIHFAYLTDRVMINYKRKQIYGTQLQINIDSTSYEPRPLLYPNKINSLRENLGLDSLETYIKIHNSSYAHRTKKLKTN